MFCIFRLSSGGGLAYVGSTQTAESSRWLVISNAFDLTEPFAIYNALTHEITYLHAEEAVDEPSAEPGYIDP